MEVEEIRMRDRLKTRGLKNKGIVEILENPKTGDFVVIVGKNTRREWGIFNLPEGMWRVKCSREEVLDVVKDFLVDKVLVG